MADRTAIEWTDATWNPLRGCTRVSEGCRNCYAEIMAARFNGPGQWGEGLATMTRVHHTGKFDHRWTGKVVQAPKDVLTQPLRWKRPRRIFVTSTSDPFHESVPDDWIDRIFAVMALAPQHTFQVLTKRPERAWQYLAASRSSVVCREAFDLVCEDHIRNPNSRLGNQCIMTGDIPHLRDWPLPNVWLGTSIEDQATADARIPCLLMTPSAVRFISAEPLLGPVDLTRLDTVDDCHTNALSGKTCGPVPTERFTHPRLDWVICGGESGPGARPMHPDWARSLRDQCQAAGVAFFFKQWGQWACLHDHEGRRDWMLMTYDGKLDLPDDRWPDEEAGEAAVVPVGKKAAGRLLDGREWNQMPGVRP